MATTADLMLNVGHHSLSKKRRHSLNNCVFEYNTRIQTSAVLVDVKIVRRGSAEVLRSVMSVKKQNSSSNQRTFDILTSSWNRTDLTFAGLAEIGECNDENHGSNAVNDEDKFEKVN